MSRSNKKLTITNEQWLAAEDAQNAVIAARPPWYWLTIETPAGNRWGDSFMAATCWNRASDAVARGFTASVEVIPNY